MGLHGDVKKHAKGLAGKTVRRPNRDELEEGEPAPAFLEQGGAGPLDFFWSDRAGERWERFSPGSKAAVLIDGMLELPRLALHRTREELGERLFAHAHALSKVSGTPVDELCPVGERLVLKEAATHMTLREMGACLLRCVSRNFPHVDRLHSVLLSADFQDRIADLGHRAHAKTTTQRLRVASAGDKTPYAEEEGADIDVERCVFTLHGKETWVDVKRIFYTRRLRNPALRAFLLHVWRPHFLAHPPPVPVLMDFCDGDEHRFAPGTGEYATRPSGHTLAEADQSLLLHMLRLAAWDEGGTLGFICDTVDSDLWVQYAIARRYDPGLARRTVLWIHLRGKYAHKRKWWDRLEEAEQERGLEPVAWVDLNVAADFQLQWFDGSPLLFGLACMALGNDFVFAEDVMPQSLPKSQRLVWVWGLCFLHADWAVREIEAGRCDAVVVRLYELFRAAGALPPGGRRKLHAALDELVHLREKQADQGSLLVRDPAATARGLLASPREGPLTDAEECTLFTAGAQQAIINLDYWVWPEQALHAPAW